MAITGQPDHTCETCGKPATDCYREGRGTGHSEHVCACSEHTEGSQVIFLPRSFGGAQ